MAVTKEVVLQRLSNVKSPDGRPLPTTGAISDIVVSEGKVFFSITADAAVVQSWEPVRKAAEAVVRGLPGVNSAMVALTAGRSPGQGLGPAPTGSPPTPRGAAPNQVAPNNVKSIIAIASGTGGVGKSTVAANLAL